MNNFANLVPNHEYRRGTDSCRLCVCELSIVIFAVCASVMIAPGRCHDTMTTPRSEWVVIHHVGLNFSRRRFSGLRSGSHASRLSQCIGVRLVVRVVEATDVLRILREFLVSDQRCWGRTQCCTDRWSYKRTPGRRNTTARSRAEAALRAVVTDRLSAWLYDNQHDASQLARFPARSINLLYLLSCSSGNSWKDKDDTQWTNCPLPLSLRFSISDAVLSQSTSHLEKDCLTRTEDREQEMTVQGECSSEFDSGFKEPRKSSATSLQ